MVAKALWVEQQLGLGAVCLQVTEEKSVFVVLGSSFPFSIMQMSLIAAV